MNPRHEAATVFPICGRSLSSYRWARARFSLFGHERFKANTRALLLAPALDELGLVGAVRERALRYDAGDNGFRVKVEAPDELSPLPAAGEVAAYRIVQEALTNVSRHAKAHSCTVRLAGPTGQTLEVEVTDDGVGLPDTPEGGVGLSSMRERAVELGGECEIGRSSRTTGDTRVFARLPLIGPEGRAV